MIQNWKELLEDLDDKVGIRYPHLLLICFENDIFFDNFIKSLTHICEDTHFTVSKKYFQKNTEKPTIEEYIRKMHKKHYIDTVFFLTLKKNNAAQPTIIATHYEDEEDIEVQSSMYIIHQTMHDWWNLMQGYFS